MSNLLKTVDARTRLAGANKLEILLFTLGVDQRNQAHETFGINVFKVREVMQAPPITRAPEMPDIVEGMVSLRGALLPVVDLAKYVGIKPEKRPAIMIVTEYNGLTQGFLVEAVDTILRLDWSAMKVPPAMVSSRHRGLVTSVTELSDGRLAMMLDVERVLADTAHYDDDVFKGIEALVENDGVIVYADDSFVARKQIERTLAALGVKGVPAANGVEAWEGLQHCLKQAESEGRKVAGLVKAVLTDIEMPEMDGFMLTRRIKSDPRFSTIPVVMHSSLSGATNQNLGRSVGADHYVTKFEPKSLAAVLAKLLSTEVSEAKVAAALESSR